MNQTRTILHLDMDAFFASIEQLDNPALRGKPILVGYDGPRGVVTTASYEARPFGCRSAQPMAVAKRLCPHAIVVPVRGHRYREVSHQVFDLLDKLSPLVEPLSIDEAFVDLTGTEKLLGPAHGVAQKLKADVKRTTGLTASVGIAPNKFLAKLASDLKKPDGLVVITPSDIDTLLPPLPATRIWGIGPATASRLKLLGINTIGDLRNFPLDVLQQHLGNEADHYLRLARGLDERPVATDGQAKSIGQEQTFDIDLGNPDDVAIVLLDQVDQVARRLRKHNLFARTLTLKIRFGDFQTVTRSRTLPEPTHATAELEQLALSIWREWVAKSFHPVRLIGATASQLSAPAAQLSLLPDPQKEKQSRLDALTDQITARFGPDALKRPRHYDHD